VGLNKCSAGRVVCLPELLGSAVFFIFKDAVEVGHVIESAFVGNFTNALCGFYKQP
jgi:hypothetical protein